MPRLRFSPERRVTAVLLPNAIISSIRDKAPTAYGHNEQGGLLLGYRKGNTLEVCSATFPTHWDHATPTLFKRSIRGHRMSALREWVRSGHTVDWVGEWHTHPGGRAHPSWIDLRSWRGLVAHTKQPMAFIILSHDSIYLGLQATPRSAIKQLRSVEADNQFALYV